MARPKRQFSDEEEQKIKQYALNNCLTNTIAVALDIPLMTLKRRYGKKLRHWRAQGKVELRNMQRDLAKTNATMAQFLGKNELNQTDRQEIETIGADRPVLTDQEREYYRKQAKGLLKLRTGA